MATEQRGASRVGIGHDGYPKTGNPMVDRRMRKHVDAVVLARFEAEVVKWAASDTGRLGTRLGILKIVSAEMVLLAEALGSWASVAPSEIFPVSREHRFRHGRDIG